MRYKIKDRTSKVKRALFKLLSLVCAVAVLSAGWGELFSYALDSIISKELIASDGKTYTVTVHYNSESGIPENASLDVRMLTGEEYEEYISRASDVLGVDSLSYGCAFDIKITDENGNVYQPSSDVSVDVRLVDIPEDADNIQVIHFDEEPEILACRQSGGSVEFDTDGFSVYVLCAYTVDFHWADYTYSIKGRSEITLSGLLNKLDITDFAVEDVENVSFSNPDYLEIEQLEADWMLRSLKPFRTEETLTVTLINGQSIDIRVTDDNPVVTREFVSIEGSWAYWRVVVNPEHIRLNDSENQTLTLEDTFHDEVVGDVSQSIDYSSIRVEGSDAVSYDYSGYKGTFIVPDETTVTVTYRTRITADPGQNATFRGTAVLKNYNGTSIGTATASEEHVIYPSASDVAGFGNNFMLKLYVYGNGQMQTGIAGAKFILLDENKKPLEYKVGANAGDPVTFTTDSTGHVNVELHEESGDVSIEKNTAYYLEMINSLEAYQKDNTLYGFMITDDPSYNSGSVYTFYNGDTLKVRLYDAVPGLSVTLRFSGNYELSQSAQNCVSAVLQKKNGEGSWVEIERHQYSDAQYGSISFTSQLEAGSTYRVIQEDERPWDVPETIKLTSAYYCIVGAGESDQYFTPQEFTVPDGQENARVSVVIDNRYEEPTLTLIKMDKQTGEYLQGAEFKVKKASDDTVVKTFTTGSNGEVEISGGADYESETLYYIEETQAPSGYLLPLEPEKIYFYFCNDSYQIPAILSGLPAGKTAVNLSENFETLTVDNQKETVSVPVMKTWQGNVWPGNVTGVVVGLYKKTGDADPVAVLNDQSQPMTVTLTKNAPYNNTTFSGLPARENGSNITYSIKEEHVYADNDDIISNYVQEYGVSDSGVYIVRNREATSLAVTKEWYDLVGVKVTDAALLAAQSDVTFDIYRSTVKIADDVRADGITNDEMTTFAASIEKVRTGLTFGKDDNWQITVSDLEKKDDFGNIYYYYVLETVPSFGDEVYEVDETNGTATIKNKVAPETVSLTVKKAALVNDPRPESVNTDFSFTLALNKGSHPIRSYTVADGMTTNWDGEVVFTLKPEQQIALTLPVGVTATVTETYNPEYLTTSASGTLTDLDTQNGSIFKYDVTAGTDNALITFTNTLHVICKVVDNNGNEYPYESLKSALKYIRDNHDAAYVNGVATIQMLDDYIMPATDVFDVQAGENIVLTTATTDTSAQFPFITSRTDNPDTAIITRGGEGGSLLTNAGTLSLDKIILDGDGGNITVTADGGLVNNSGTLNINGNAILRNSSVNGSGSAVYSTGTINMTGGHIENNTGASDGAVVSNGVNSRIKLSGDPVINGNTNAQGNPANLYIGADSDIVVQVVSPGLGSSALIGITAMEGHREIGEQFASTEYGVSANLNRFISDTYGYRGKLKDGSSTNIVWDGLTLTVKKTVDPVGANPNDTFTITLSSSVIKKSSYIINGTVDYTVTPSKNNRPGTIELRNVRDAQEITISPLPVGDYTIVEADSNYTPVYTGKNTELGNASIAIVDGVFTLDGNSTVTVTNTRRLATVKLHKSVKDRLVGDDTVNFPFTVKLTEEDGSAVQNYTLADGITTDSNGEVTFNMSPKNNAPFERQFTVPVGADMKVTENGDGSYNITVSAVTMPSGGAGTAISDGNTTDDNIFEFTVSDDGADISFDNVRKMAEIELRKDLVGKVSKEENFTFNVTLKNSDNSPAANYLMYEDESDPANNITTDANGNAVINFEFGQNVTSQSVVFTLPEGTKLTVAETEVKKDVGGTQQSIYNTTYSINGGTAANGLTATIDSVSESDSSIVFTNTRKTQNITVTNTVAGYAGNIAPFTFTASVTDGNDNDYDANGFTDGGQTFELATGQSKVLTVPYGATLNIAESFVIGYETKVKHGSDAAVVGTSDEFTVTEDLTVAFTNDQLINIVLVNNTSHDIANIQLTFGYATKMYRVSEAHDSQTSVPMTNKTATVSVAAGETAILEVNHETSQTAEQAYTVKGTMPSAGYYYTINNEPSFHEFANPAVLRVYNNVNFEVKGRLRYSTSDSTVTFSEQPLVSFDVNGGSWTTAMEDYHWDSSRQVYQIAVTEGEKVSKPTDPAYPTSEEGITFLGWTANETFAKDHEEITDDSYLQYLYDFNAPVNGPLTLFALWSKASSEAHIVTVKNGSAASVNVTVTLTQNGVPVAGHDLGEYTTDANGSASFSLGDGAANNLEVPDGVKLVISVDSSVLIYSSDFADADNSATSFTIDSVKKDGTVAFTGGICKITDSTGNILYDGSGDPAVYPTLAAAFTAYNGTLYTDANHSTAAQQTAVKMLIDEYALSAKLAFPTKNMTLTTAGKGDTSFPYVGSRDRATLYRDAAFKNDSLFNLESSGREITLTNIILDGKNVALNNTVNGNIILVNHANAVLNIQTGTIIRNTSYINYTEKNGGRGAIYVSNSGTINVTGGFFSNLHARCGGAICVLANGNLNITGINGDIRFENCSTDANSTDNNGGDGGAICYTSTKELVIDGGTDKNNPGILFNSCVAGSNFGSGGAIYAFTNQQNSVTVSGCDFTECSSRTTETANAANGGGAICANGVSSLNVSNCTFSACDTMSRGGAVVVYVKNGNTVSFSDSSFERCNAKGQGGALAIYQPNQESSTAPSATTAYGKTKLVVDTCIFNNCSSGTQNGSGGAIQCYVPCMEFTNSNFTDCWAGKEGGAVNNYFGNGYTVTWQGSYLTLDNCRFVRCRAEDRYDPTAFQHYGGGINTKVTIAEITNSYFEDCVSTLKEGGALHLGGQGGGSRATVTGTTFKNCSAKNGGGAILSSHETLVVEDSEFYGCSSFASNAGAVYHYRNSRGDSTQKTTTISGCTFSADPASAASQENPGCSAAQDGGAVWTRAETVTISDTTISDCTAGGKGGAIFTQAKTASGINNCTISNCTAVSGGGVYQSTNSSVLTYTAGSISGCQADNGSAVYLENKSKATFSGISITGNNVNSVNSGAVQGGDDSILYFEGDVIVEENTCSADSAYDHDVLMHRNNNDDAKMTVVQTTATGLGEHAHVGIYVPDNIFDRRGTEGMVFGKYANAGNGSANLECFFNDRDEMLTGYEQASANNYICWGRYICKITDENGNTLKRTNGKPAVYQSLTGALNDFTSVIDDNDAAGKAKYIKILIEFYPLMQNATVTSFPEADVTITTAGSDDSEFKYQGTSGSLCTIFRDSKSTGNNQMFKISNANTTLRFENIILDGRKNLTGTEGNFRFVEVEHGNLFIGNGATLQYGYPGSNSNGGAVYLQNNDNASMTVSGGAVLQHCKAKNGGAIYASAKAKLLVNSEEGRDIMFSDCSSVSSDTNSKTEGGGAIHAVGNLTVSCNTAGDGTHSTTYFTNCTAPRGGAIVCEGTSISINGAEFTNCSTTRSDGGALYHHNNGNGTTTTILSSTFTNCCTDALDKYSNGGAVSSKAKTLYVESCRFESCYALSNGGAINHGSENPDRETTTIKSTVFDGCHTTGTTTGYSYGGSIYSQAKIVNITEDCEIKNSTATNSGGGLYCSNKCTVTISGTSTFEKCVVSGGENKSGAIQVAVAGSTLNISGNAKISSCYANIGGAVYLKNGVTLNITGSPEFTQNGYMAQGGNVLNAEKGPCIYLEQGSKLNLSGSPKFSRNIITAGGQNALARIVNGGITDYVRQDVYMAGYGSVTAASIHIAGDLTGDTVWIWPELAPHRIPGDQFATTEAGVSDASLNLLRNALDDSVTTCSNGEFLAGVRFPGNSTTVYWSKMYNISFRKIDNKAVAVPGAGFTLYNDSGCTVVRAASTSADGETDTNAQGDLLDKGVVDFTSIPIGVYYMKETSVPESFVAEEITYLVLVGTPMLSPNTANEALWEGDGPLAVDNAATLVARYTTDSGKYYGIYPLGANGKADLSKNLASANTGIVNIRSDYEAYFLKVDASGALPGAAFTIYTQKQNSQGQPLSYANHYPQLELWSRDGEHYPDPVQSADGSPSFKRLDGSNVPKGVVYFRELPIGVYYLVETAYPDRNGSGKRTFYVENDDVYQLEVNGSEGFVLRKLKADGSYEVCAKNGNYYVVGNTEAVCKLTDGNGNLLYELGRDGDRLLPAVYADLEDGFDAAQTHDLYNKNSQVVAGGSSDPALKLQVLKDLSITAPVNYSSPRNLTLTTAERTATASDRYVFVTNRTSDTSRADIGRAYSENTASNANNGALITVAEGADLTLQNISLNGHKANYNGRAIHVTKGSLTVLNNVRLHNFKQEAAADSTDSNAVKGGAILMENSTTLTVDGGAANRSAVFSNNEVSNNRGTNSGAFGGAVFVGENCTVSLRNAQFTGNKASSASADAGCGGAVSFDRNGSALQLTNAVFTSNEAKYSGGALQAEAGCELALTNCIARSNSAALGSALFAEDGTSSDMTVVTIKDGTFTANQAGASDGGAVNAGGVNVRLYFEGSPTVFGNTYASNANAQRNVVLSEDSNEIIQTTAFGLKGGKIGVYVIDGGDCYKDHGISGKPFGTFDLSNAGNLNLFVNDRNQALYGVRNSDDDSDVLIYWVNFGYPVAFMKTDSFGNALNGATFALYTNQACTASYDDRTAVSADGTSTKNEGGEVLTKGTVLFETIPDGVYYMKETVKPGDGYKANSSVYVVLVGADTNRPASVNGTLWAAGSLLGDITQAAVNGQISTNMAKKTTYKIVEDSQYAIFQIDADTGKAVTTPDIAKYGVMNVSATERRAILRKVDNMYKSLAGAEFEILRCDMTPVKGTDVNGTETASFTSDASGTYFVDMMPFGKYYVHETTTPATFNTLGDGTNWYELTVNADGVVCSDRLTAAP